MFCTQCGKQLQEGDRFCSSCGKPVLEPPCAGILAAPLQPRPRRLLRIMSQKKIAGVCAGFAAYFGMDLTLMRLIFLALLVLPPSIGGIGYIIAWIAVPRDDEVPRGETI